MRDQKDVHPAVGVAVVVEKKGKILIGEDQEKGELIYGVPGGHWENQESLKECALREVKEESGLDCDQIELVSVYDFYRKDKEKSYVTLGMKAKYVAGKPANLEKEGRKNWQWYDPEEALKLNLFPPDAVLINRYLSGVIFS